MKPGGADRLWRRLAIAAPLSLCAHIVVLMLTRPEYRAVSDVAVDLDVIEAAPGPPPRAPEPEPAPPEPEPAPVAPPPEDVVAVAKGDAVEKPARVEDAGVATAASADAGPREVAAAEVDAGAGEGGICLHDLFPYAPADPSWLAWVSMSSFRGTAFEDGFARLLSAFTLYREMAGATGLRPGKDVEGFLVTADPFDDPSSYRVIATYDSGQSALLGALRESSKGAAGFTVVETPSGYEAAIPGAYRWSLVGSGRVLAVAAEPPLENLGAAGASTEVDAGKPALRPVRHPEWPKDVTCLVPVAAPGKKADATLPLGLRARALLGPDGEGHWPALAVATRDPRALGLPRQKSMPAQFLWAYAAVTFSEPLRAEAIVAFDGTDEQVESVAEEWRAMLAAAGKDPFLALAGLNGVLDEVKIERDGTRLRVLLPLTERQVRAALILLEMQASSVDAQIRRKR